MSREDRSDADAVQLFECLCDVDPCETHGAESAAQGTALWLRRGAEVAGEPTALAVIGFSKVDQLEVEGEGAGKLIGRRDVQRLNTLQGVLHRFARGGGPGARRGASGGGSSSLLLFLTACDGGKPEFFDAIEG